MYIYAYSMPQYKGLLKIGETIRKPEERIKEQLSVLPKFNKEPIYKIELIEEIKGIRDTQIHKQLKKNKIRHISGEWFECTTEELKLAISQVKPILKNKKREDTFIKCKKQEEEFMNFLIDYSIENFSL